MARQGHGPIPTSTGQDAATATVLDVTLRDGGYVNGHGTPTERALAIARAVADTGVAHVEVGYLRPRIHGTDAHRPTACGPPEFLAAVRDLVPAHVGIVVMAHMSEIEPGAVGLLAEHGVGLVRLPVTRQTVDRLPAFVRSLHRLGVRVSANLTRISEQSTEAVVELARSAIRSGVDLVYLADSNGAMYPDQVVSVVERVGRIADVPVGFHAHDNLRLAFANTLSALEGGATYVDATVGGIGKGGGNLALELIGAHLAARAGVRCAFGSIEVAAELVARSMLVTGEHGLEHIAAGVLNLNIDDLARLDQAQTSVLSRLDALGASSAALVTVR